MTNQRPTWLNAKQQFLILTIITAWLIGFSGMNFEDSLSQGDHGRDLYAAEAVFHGDVPYKDFWWVYGPLMPYYYGIFYKILGVKISSILIGKWFVFATCGVFFYLAATVLMPAFIAYIGAAWFMVSQQDFFFTYNHIGGIALELFIFWCLLSFISTRHQSWLWRTLPAIVLFCFVKINFGLVSLIVTFLTTVGTGLLWRQKPDLSLKKFYAILLLAVPALVAFVYWLTMIGLPFYEIRQCHPYFGDDQPHHATLLATTSYYLTQQWLTFVHVVIIPIQALISGKIPVGITTIFIVLNAFSHVLIHVSWVISLMLLVAGLNKDNQKILTSLAVLGVFFVLNMHEFVVSGVWYRCFWSMPFVMFFNILMIATALSIVPKAVRAIVWIILAFLIGVSIYASAQNINAAKQAQQYLSMPRGHVYVGNEPQWVQAVNQTTAYLSANLKNDETFFALPYDDLYYYLVGKKSPTRQLIFFDHIKIPPQQEVSVIKELESKNVKFVVMSNRYRSNEIGLGEFGKTYCPLISNYIAEHYQPVGRIGGNWNEEPGWANNHGVMILQRK